MMHLPIEYMTNPLKHSNVECFINKEGRGMEEFRYLRGVMKNSYSKYNGLILGLNYAGRFLGAINAFVLLPCCLSLGERGCYAGIHHLIFLLGRIDLSQGVIRYGSSLVKNKRGRAGFLGWIWFCSTVLYIGMISFFGVLWKLDVLGVVLKDVMVVKYFGLVGVVGYIVILNVVLKAWSVALSRVGWPSFFQHVVVNLLLSSVFVLYGRGYFSFEVFLWMVGSTYVLNLCLLLLDLWLRGELRIRFDGRFWERDFVWSFFRYSFFACLTGSMPMLMIRLDNVMVFGMCGSGQEALYATITSLVLLLEVPMKVVKQTTSSRLRRSKTGR